MTSTEDPAAASRPARRPRSVVAAVALFATWWVASAGAMVFMAVAQTDGWGSGEWTVTGGMAFWTAVVAAMLRATWRGGPIAWWFLNRIGIGFGALTLVGGLVLTFLSLSGDLFDGSWQLLPLPFVSGGVLLSAGFLLRRDDARRWCRVIPGVTTPPDRASYAGF